MLQKLLTILLILSLSPAALAEEKLPVPRFVSLKSSETNMRTGPNVRYPIKWVYQREGYPVEVIAEFENWRQIRDKDKEEGWVHESLLAGRRSVIITGKAERFLYQAPDVHSFKVLRVEPGVIAGFKECKDKLWCQITVDGTKGWIEKQYLWGVYAYE